jgi:hypothetical protein
MKSARFPGASPRTQERATQTRRMKKVTITLAGGNKRDGHLSDTAKSTGDHAAIADKLPHRQNR